MRGPVIQLTGARKKASEEAQPRNVTLIAIWQPAMTFFFFGLLILIMLFSIIMPSPFTFLFPSTLALEFSAGVEWSALLLPSKLSSASTSASASLSASPSPSTLVSLTSPPPSELSVQISFPVDIYLASASHSTFGRFLEPIDENGSSVFKLGSTIPIKFKLKSSDGQQQQQQQQTNATAEEGNKAQIFTAKVSDRVIGSEVETSNEARQVDEAAGSIASRGERVGRPALPAAAPSPDAVDILAGTTEKPTPGNNFLHDPLTDEFLFNLGTKDLTPGTWQIKIILDDGSSHTANMSLVR